MAEKDASYRLHRASEYRIAQPTEYSTASGHKVILCKLRIQYFLEGISEGHPQCWRDSVINHVRQQSNILKEPPEKVIPRYIFLGDFYDFSSRLIVCWFGDNLTGIEEQITENLATIDWEKRAVPDLPGED
jgi:hypothetical protein